MQNNKQVIEIIGKSYLLYETLVYNTI
jgi:hypothetical protein